MIKKSRKNTKAIGEAIAKGICDYYEISTEEKAQAEKNNASSKEKALYSVQVGAFSNKKNAEKYKRSSYGSKCNYRCR